MSIEINMKHGDENLDINYFKNTFRFSTDNNIPLYEQLASYIKIQIQAGILKPGDQMITENSLCEALNISRTTVRQCMNRLVEEGLLIRQRGKGSFIADQKFKRNIDYLYNFTENMRSIGAIPTSIVLTKEVISITDSRMVELLQLPKANPKAFHLIRLRCANGEPLLLENTYIPYYLCNEIERFDFQSASLYDTLNNQYALNLYHASETIESIIIKERVAHLLKCNPNIAGYRIERISHLDSGYVFELTTSTTRADKCVFRLELYKKTASSKGKLDFQRSLSI
ncbi:MULTISPECIES: GntR family transcriptional regulator [unclassified Sporolactobacillus]|uniref:GntR family transcriptional regulator n=1 Tax=unclassified Sporolactobacillus TaxID=2628533 RepID=UPI0023674296|nr:GntR family transcriptional regulator [Sporolactobacillus sp. CQH2019]MDD9150166.1 GntR family transcriptional regulator [Sporolactobacillus sp. CQH2019]